MTPKSLLFTLLKLEFNIRSRREKHRNRSLSLLKVDDDFKLPTINAPATARRHQKALSSYRLIDYSMENIAYKGKKLNYLCTSSETQPAKLIFLMPKTKESSS
jgi:hypothetical protein